MGAVAGAAPGSGDNAQLRHAFRTQHLEAAYRFGHRFHIRMTGCARRTTNARRAGPDQRASACMRPMHFDDGSCRRQST
ncbi:hypothetical protein BSLA_01r3332 [Burkholderia stabilis]|nr:hypothetical protein BSLA_01r3332 [Burkholderia stabilis]